MKYIVRATQLITQDVTFIVDVPEDTELTPEEFAAEAIRMRSTDPAIQLYDSEDEVYHRNIVTEVRPATEEESK